ncbi:ribosomal protein S18-alanine N-acetyltransferase [Roseibium sp.]|uniref:ribosomal protein S18-alanine N-acetyltransferase n=1 Tax=Roseibium sp. TaxID=1936156 RepID=UPI003A96BEE5
MNFLRSRTAPSFVEDAKTDDLTRLAEIHSRSFTHSWDEEELSRLMDQAGVFVLVIRRPVALGSRKVLGFIMIRTVAGEAEILTIAVDPKNRGEGLARQLLREALFRLYSERCEALFLEVDAANEPALKLYKSAGFRKVGERKGYYRAAEGDGTALVMRADLL